MLQIIFYIHMPLKSFSKKEGLDTVRVSTICGQIRIVSLTDRMEQLEVSLCAVFMASPAKKRSIVFRNQ